MHVFLPAHSFCSVIRRTPKVVQRLCPLQKRVNPITTPSPSKETIYLSLILYCFIRWNLPPMESSPVESSPGGILPGGIFPDGIFMVINGLGDAAVNSGLTLTAGQRICIKAISL